MTYDAHPAIGDPAAFDRLAENLRADLADATGTDSGGLRPVAGASLAILRVAGSLILPAVRDAAASHADGRLDDLVAGPLTDLVTTASGTIPPAIAWGNIASVLEASARMVAREDPATAEQAYAVATAALLRKPLRDAWTGEVGTTFRRTTCCQVTDPDPAGMRCGDCVRIPAPPT